MPHLDWELNCICPCYVSIYPETKLYNRIYNAYDVLIIWNMQSASSSSSINENFQISTKFSGLIRITFDEIVKNSDKFCC